MKSNEPFLMILMLFGVMLFQACNDSSPAPANKTWSDYREPFESLSFNDNTNPYEDAGIEHNAMMEYYQDYILSHPVTKPLCGDYWDDPDCKKIESAIKSGLVLKAAYDEQESSDEYLRLFEERNASIIAARGFDSTRVINAIGMTSQFLALRREVNAITPSNLNTFEDNMDLLLLQVREDSTIDDNIKKLLSVGITVGKYSAYFHIERSDTGNSKAPWGDIVIADIMGFIEGCIACEELGCVIIPVVNIGCCIGCGVAVGAMQSLAVSR